MHQNEVKLLEVGKLVVIHCPEQKKKHCMFDSPLTSTGNSASTMRNRAAKPTLVGSRGVRMESSSVNHVASSCTWHIK